MKNSKGKISEELHRRLSNSLDRQLKGIQMNAKLALDATYGENYKEILSWISNAQSCVNEATAIACELRDSTKA